MTLARTLSTSAALALALVAAPASAAQVVFTFSGTVSSAATPGVSVGDAVTIDVFADNGGSSLANQTFVYSDLQSIALVSGAYQATYSTAFFGGSSTGFSTNASGQVSIANFYGSTVGSNQDNFGNDAGVYLFNGAFRDYNFRINSISESFQDPANFTVAFAGGVPEPGTWAFMILGFGAMGAAMRKRQRAPGSFAPA